MDKDSDRKASRQTERKAEKSKSNVDHKWIVFVFLFSFFVSAVMYMLTELVMNDRLNPIISFLLLFLIIGLGILFDIIGVAVTTAPEEPFHSMAARRKAEGKAAVRLIRNAARVSSFCNDVIGDIAGVVSGAASTAIALAVFTNTDAEFWGKMFVTALVSAVTVGGKAVGKGYAIRYSKSIVYTIVRIMTFFSFPKNKKSK